MLRWCQIAGCSLVLFWLLGNIKLGSNPTYYRSPSQYFGVLLSQIQIPDITEPQQSRSLFQVQRATSVHAYVKVDAFASPPTLATLTVD